MVELPRLPTVAVERGLSMFGVQSGNYGHWFVEFLPKMLVLDRDEPADVPIYIDRGMPPTHLESLQILNSSNRPIRYMPEDSIVHFGQLGVAPVPAYFPLDLKRNASYDTVWPADVFSDLRSVLMRRVEQSEEVSLRSKRPLFISRKGFASRQLLNEAEISDFLASFGFETIYPEQLTFAEQVNVFRSASIVVGSCSSALTNCLFCDPDCPVIGLIHDEPSFNFNGYSSFLLSGGVRIIFVRGKSLKEVGTHPLHSRYIVAPDRVLEAMRMSGWDGQILGKSSVGGSGTSDTSAALAASAPLHSTAFNQSGLAPS
jgi:capsular polysaccharide biosynthesis protein